MPEAIHKMVQATSVHIQSPIADGSKIKRSLMQVILKGHDHGTSGWHDTEWHDRPLSDKYSDTSIYILHMHYCELDRFWQLP